MLSLVIESLHFIVDEPAVHDDNVSNDDITQAEQNGKPWFTVIQ